MLSAISIGKVRLTEMAQRRLNPSDVLVALENHKHLALEGAAGLRPLVASVTKRGRIISIHIDRYGTVFEIITNEDHSDTSVLVISSICRA